MRHSLLPKETLSDVKFEVEEAVALAAAASPTPSCASSIAGPISIYGDSMVSGWCEDRCNSCVMISLRPVAGSKTENRWKAAMEKRDVGLQRWRRAMSDSSGKASSGGVGEEGVFSFHRVEKMCEKHWWVLGGEEE